MLNSSLLASIFLFVSSLLLLSCSQQGDANATNQDASTEGKLQVVASVAMLGDLVREVGGERVAVKQIFGSGSDPHSEELKRSDVVAMQEAQLIFYNGLFLEGTMGKRLEALEKEGKHTIVAVAEQVQLSGYSVLEESGEADPHLWMDVQAWMLALEVITQTLTELDPEGKELFEANAAAYSLELEALDAYARETIASIPENQRVLITAHDAFGYLSRAHGIEVLGIQGISTTTEASLRRNEELVALITERKIPAIFPESSVSDKNVTALAEGAAAKGHEVQIGGKLFSDAMGAEGSYEGTYLGMIDHNVTTIARALGGEAPEKGRLGKLKGD